MNLLALTLSALLGATSPGDVDPSSRGPSHPVLGDSLQVRGPQVVAQDGGGQRAEPRRKLRVIRLEELKIEGRIQKPQAFYLLQRSNLNFDDLNREESFLDKVVEAVEKPPF